MKRILIILSLVLAGIGFWGFSFTEVTQDDERLLMTVMTKVLNENHYAKLELDDKFSERVFDLYLKRMDYNKMYFLKKDIKGFEGYRHRLDEDLIKADLSFYKEVTKVFDKRLDDVEDYVNELLDKRFDFDVKESYEADPDKREYADSEKELKELWRKYLKYSVLNSYLGKLENQEKAIENGADSTGSEFEVKTEEELLDASFDAVKKNMKRRFDRRGEVDEEDNFALFLNSISGAYDPHTQYFPPQEKENFDMRMTGRLEGIGAVLQEDEGYIKINSIVTGSACWRQGDLEVGDLILKVAQGPEEPVDIVDAPMKEVLKLIRGPKGTEVRLTVQKKDGRITIIPIVRDVVIREETYAKSAVIEDKETSRKYGYLYLPGFYSKFGQREGRSSSDDVDKELEKLVAQGVEGIVFDLRNNGGGSLPDAVEMAGLFIKDGPIVQVRASGQRPYVKADYNSSISYDGPLIIMTNTFSASASEILSAALKDYGRAYIVGSPSTYGKGTVQTFMDLNRFVRPGVKVSEPFGSLKFTVQQFYRINGASTQFNGVKPHIELPDLYDINEVGERSLDYAVQWDSVATLPYTKWNSTPVDLRSIRQNSETRRSSNEYFQLIEESKNEIMADNENSAISLYYDDVKLKRDERKASSEALKSARLVNEDLSIRSLQQIKIEGDTIATERIKNWEKQISKDAYLHETLDIMDDIIEQISLAAAETK